MQNEKPIATPWLKETHENAKVTGDSHQEEFKHTRAAVKAITDARLETVSPPPQVFEKPPPSPESFFHFPVPTSTALTTSNCPLPVQTRLRIVSEDEVEEKVNQSANSDSHKRYSPVISPRHGPGHPLKRRISWHTTQSSRNLTIPEFYRSKSVQHDQNNMNVFGHNLKQVEHVLQRMADAIKMDLQHKV